MSLDTAWRIDESEHLLATLRAKGWSMTKIAVHLGMTKAYLRSELAYSRRHGLIAWRKALELKAELLKR